MDAIVVHAGLPKTGTTWLQRRFVDNRAWLRDRGVDYPELGQERQLGHHDVARHFHGEAVDAPWSQLDDAPLLDRLTAGAAPRTLLSSEEFSSLRGAQADRLARALGDRDVTWVVYVRRRSALCASRWQTEVKHGSTRTFPEYLTAQLLGAGDVLRVEDAIAAAIRAFGLPAVRVVVFDDLVARGADLFAHFVGELLGLPCDDAVPAGAARANEALPLPFIETLRAVNAAGELDGAYALGRRATASATQRFLAEHAEGRALVDEVAAVFEREAEPLALGQLDRQWIYRDREILRVCGDRVLNPAGPDELFPEAEAPAVRALPPSRLHQHLPAARFAEVARRLRG